MASKIAPVKKNYTLETLLSDAFLGHTVNKLIESLVKMTHKNDTFTTYTHYFKPYACTLILKSFVLKRHFECGLLYFLSFKDHAHSNVFWG